MAIIVLQHTVADNFNVDPAYSIPVSGRIPAGTLVGLTSAGFVKKAGATDALGIAGDSLSDEYRTTPLSADLIISPSGAKRYTQNRVDNYFNETLASGKMTVYTAGGLFGTSEYVLNLTYTPGLPLFSNAGLFTVTNPGSGRAVGYVRSAPGEYPSGVPGVDAPSAQNSISLGRFLFVQLSI